MSDADKFCVQNTNVSIILYDMVTSCPAFQDGFVPNKALGQNFLTDEGVISAILDASGADDLPVLEIGAGRGALTRGLVCRAKRVVAVEKDARLVSYLQQTLESERLTLVHADFLDADIPALMERAPYVAVGNLPYFITTPIVEKLLSLSPDRMTLMVQAEAAERFFACPRARVYGPVAVLTQVYYEAETLFPVPRTAFFPQPDVTSVVVRLTRRAKAEQADEQEPAGFLRFVKRAFSMRRKTLKNNLPDAADLAACCTLVGAMPSDRAEALSPETLFGLYKAVSKEITP